MWAIVVIVIVGMICLICVLYFVAFASLPPRRAEDKEMEILITELETKHPDVDFENLKAQIYAELPRDASAIQNNYASLNVVEAQRLVDEAVKMHDAPPRHSLLNPPFRGLFTRQYGKAPRVSARGSSVATASYGGVTPSASVTSGGNYGIMPQSSANSYGGVPESLNNGPPPPVDRPLPSVPASNSQYGLVTPRSPRD